MLVTEALFLQVEHGAPPPFVGDGTGGEDNHVSVNIVIVDLNRAEKKSSVIQREQEDELNLRFSHTRRNKSSLNGTRQ